MELNIAKSCIICLKKKSDTINLMDDCNKLNELSLLSHCKFVKYMEYSQCLCYSCNRKLKTSFSFQQQILKSIKFLDNYVKHETNENYTEDSYEMSNVQDEEHLEKYGVSPEKDETYLEIVHSDDNLHTAENSVRKLTADSILVVPLEEANKIIEEFKMLRNGTKYCVCCDFIGAGRRSLTAHMLNAHREKRDIWCRDCNNFFENIGEHKKDHIGKHTCPFCGKKKNSSHFVEHIQSHTGKFECKICNKKFYSESWLRKHKLIHSEDRPYQCPNCSRGFIQMSSLRYHVKTHGELSCVVCKKYYKTENERLSHTCILPDKKEIESITIKCEVDGISEENNSDKPLDNFRPKVSSKKPEINYTLPKEFECQICQRKFQNGYRFRLHMRRHRGTLPYKCTFCHKRIADRTELMNHKRVHTKEKPFECRFCKKMFSQKSTLAIHLKRHTGKPEVCDICGKRFCRKVELKMHLSKHKGEKPYLCMKCGKAFAQKSHLTEHMLGHGEARPYECSFCDKAFKKNNVLKSHLRLHMETKPFNCESCSYSCYTAYRLQQHVSKLHNKDIKTTLKKPEVGAEKDLPV